MMTNVEAVGSGDQPNLLSKFQDSNYHTEILS